MLTRLLPARSARHLINEICCSRGIVTEVQHASTSTGIVDDAPGPSRSSVKTRRSKLKDVIPHDPRRASLRGKVGFGSSMSSIATDSSVDKASRPRRKDAADIVRDGRPRARTENPFVLAPRLVEIHRKRGPEQALAELAKSKREARNVAVHNTLIKLLLQDGRMDMAYRVWMDVSPDLKVSAKHHI